MSDEKDRHTRSLYPDNPHSLGAFEKVYAFYFAGGADEAREWCRDILCGPFEVFDVGPPTLVGIVDHRDAMMFALRWGEDITWHGFLSVTRLYDEND